MKEKKCKHCGTKENLRTNKNGVIYNCCISCYKNIEIPNQIKKTSEAIKEKYGVSDLGELRQKRLIENPIIKKEKEIKPCKYCGTLENLVIIKGKKRIITYPACKDHWEQYQIDKDEIRKKSNIEIYGAERSMFIPEFKEKQKQTINNRTTEEKNLIQEKKRKTNLEKFGVEYPIQLKEIQKKQRNTFLERYGANHPMLIPEFVEKQKKSLLQNYGVKNPQQNEEIKERIKKTNIERYGSTYPLNNPEVREKAKNTFLKKYNVDHSSKSPIVKEKVSQTNLEKYGVNCSLKNKDIKFQVQLTSRENYWDKFLELLSEKKLIPLFNLEFYKNNKNELFKYKCTACGKEFESEKITVQRLSCGCHKNRSYYEDEIITWLNSIGISNIEKNKIFRENSRFKFEIDVFITDLNLGIDFHGLYWHSDFHVQHYYHRDKVMFFKKLGIKFIQIFENEWLSKRDIIQSIIVSKLGLNKTVYARECFIKKLDDYQYSIFLDKNHLQGRTPANIKIGLFFENELVCIASFGKNRFNKASISYELIRFANKKGTTVIGGFNKLLSFFERNYKPKELISFIDLRYFDGESYLKSGFIKEKITDPNYFYFKPNNPFILYNRMSFQKHKLINKLEIFNPELSEYDNMTANGYMRIYDAGNIKMKKTY